MREIWSEQRKLEIWLQIELLASEALVAAGPGAEKGFRANEGPGRLQHSNAARNWNAP